MIIQILYIISGILWAVEIFPQLYRTYKRKTVNDISIYYPLICFISFILFFIASYLAKNWILIYSHLMPFICNGIFLILVYIYGCREIEVTKLMNEKRLSALGMIDKKTGLYQYYDKKNNKVYLSNQEWRLYE